MHHPPRPHAHASKAGELQIAGEDHYRQLCQALPPESRPLTEAAWTMLDGALLQLQLTHALAEGGCAMAHILTGPAVPSRPPRGCFPDLLAWENQGMRQAADAICLWLGAGLGQAATVYTAHARPLPLPFAVRSPDLLPGDPADIALAQAYGHATGARTAAMHLRGPGAPGKARAAHEWSLHYHLYELALAAWWLHGGAGFLLILESQLAPAAGGGAGGRRVTRALHGVGAAAAKIWALQDTASAELEQTYAYLGQPVSALLRRLVWHW